MGIKNSESRMKVSLETYYYLDSDYWILTTGF